MYNKFSSHLNTKVRRQNLGLGPELPELSRAPEAPWAWVLAHETRTLIDLRGAPYSPFNSSIAAGDMSAYGAFVSLCNIVNNILFSHHCNTVNNIPFSHHRNTVTKSTILSIAQALRMLLLNRCIIFCFTYTCKLNKYIIHLTKTNSTVPTQPRDT